MVNLFYGNDPVALQIVRYFFILLYYYYYYLFFYNEYVLIFPQKGFCKEMVTFKLGKSK